MRVFRQLPHLLKQVQVVNSVVAFGNLILDKAHTKLAYKVGREFTNG